MFGMFDVGPCRPPCNARLVILGAWLAEVDES